MWHRHEIDAAVVLFIVNVCENHTQDRIKDAT